MESILNGLQVIIDFIAMSISSVISLCSLIPDFSSSIFSSFAYAPSFVAPFLALSGTLTLLFAIIRLVT